jgi:hypothetical protein
MGCYALANFLCVELSDRMGTLIEPVELIFVGAIASSDIVVFGFCSRENMPLCRPVIFLSKIKRLIYAI